jgi:hypothetical protein
MPGLLDGLDDGLVDLVVGSHDDLVVVRIADVDERRRVPSTRSPRPSMISPPSTSERHVDAVRRAAVGPR